jgi:hypothetical protein
MNLHRLIMFPNGTPYHHERVETDDLPREWWEPFAALFEDLRADGSVQTEHGELRVLWNSSGGAGLGTFWLAGQMFLATVFAGGTDPASDEYLLDLAGKQWDGTDMVRGFMEGKPSPFANLKSIPDRPLLAGLLVPILDPKVYEEIAGVDVLVVAAFLDRMRQVSG